MSRPLLAAGVVLALAGAVVDSAAQSARAQQQLREGIEAAARGDTLGALELIDDAIKLEPQFAAAHFHRGQLYASRSSARPTEYDDRVKAQAALEQALKFDPNNPMYLLELGKLMLRQQIRVDAERVLRRALDAAARADAATLAEVHYQLGLFRESQWLRFRHRHNLPIGIAQLNADIAFHDARYVWELLDRTSYPGEEQGASDRESMLGHYRAAVAADPAHVGANTHLLAYLYDEGQMEEYVAVARQFVRAASSSPEAFLALGLGHHRQARVDEAAGAFEYALSLMSEAERRDFESLGRIMTREAEQRYIQLSDEGRAEFQRRFWSQSDPLFLTSANEFWIEYMARMAYAEIRFGVPEYSLRGWDTDRGVIYVRYGEPSRQATFSPATSHMGDFEAIGRVTSVWTYGYRGPVFVFRQNPGYRRAAFANDFRFYAEDYRSMQPAQLTAPSIPERHPIAVQAVRFRGPAGRTDLEVHSLLPLQKLGENAAVVTGELETGFFLQDERAIEVERQTQTEVVDFRSRDLDRIESWRVTLPQGQRFLVGVEAREPLTWHAAVGRLSVESKTFPAGDLSVSDLLLADVVSPLRPEPTDRTGFRIVPNPATSYRADQPIAMYFEIYNLLPDADQFASYEVELVVTVEEIERTGPSLRRILGELADKWGFTPEGTEAVQLRFRKEAHILARDLIPEYFQVQLPDAPAGRYGLRLTVHDRNSDRRVVTEREFRIRDSRDQTP